MPHYDYRTTTFTPEGRLLQVEYAIKACDNAPSAAGIVATDGIVIAAERKVTSKLLAPTRGSEKVIRLDDHICAAVAGYNSDANILVNHARVSALRHRYQFQEDVPVEQLVSWVADIGQWYTQHGGQRPFGVAMLWAGYDAHHGFQLYKSDPAGVFGGWRAAAIGSNRQAAENLLKNEYEETINVADALKLAVQVMSKTTDTPTPSAEKMEFTTVTRDERGRVVMRQLTPDEVAALVASVEVAGADAGDM